MSFLSISENYLDPFSGCFPLKCSETRFRRNGSLYLISGNMIGTEMQTDQVITTKTLMLSFSLTLTVNKIYIEITPI